MIKKKPIDGIANLKVKISSERLARASITRFKPHDFMLYSKIIIIHNQDVRGKFHCLKAGKNFL